MTLTRHRSLKTISVLSILVLFAVLMSGASGCSLFNRGTAGNGKDPVFAGFTTVDPTLLDDDVVAAWVEACSRVPGIHAATFNDVDTYLLAVREEKTTTGYTVRLDDVAVTQGGLSLTFLTADPSPQSVTAPAIVTPLILLLMEGRPETISNILSTGPEVLPWPVQSPANAFLIPTSPLPGDEVDDLTLRLTGWARCFEGTYQYSVEDGHDVLAEGFGTATSGGPEWGTFDIEIDLEPPSSPGLTLRLFEYSAEDGSVVHEAVIPLVWGGN